MAIANQWIPYTVNAKPAMYSGAAFPKKPNHVNPTMRYTPVMNWQKPGIQNPHIPMVRSTSGLALG